MTSPVSRATPNGTQPVVGLLLSGAGFQDGSEIQEAVVAMLALEEAGAKVLCMAPAVAQTQVIDHLSGEGGGAPRQVLAESARIARGQIRDVRDVKAAELAALVVPGGYGAALNLCDFAVSGVAMRVQPDVEALLRGMHAAGKPIGAICIAPALLAKVFGGDRPRLTVGNDAGTAAALTALGAEHVDCAVDAIVVDERLRLVTTPAYMLAASVKDIHQGIRRLAETVVRMIRST